jgi:hypothetical protein
MSFQPASRKKKKLKMALFGPSGSGKTMTALRIAKGLVKTGRIAMIDTEHKSGEIYAGEKVPEGTLDYDVMQLTNFAPQNYIEGIRDAVAAKAADGTPLYEVLIIDSMSHAWAGTGGILERMDAVPAGQNKFAGWKVGDKLYRQLVDTILGANIHVIGTGRVKMAYGEETINDRKKMVKLGMAPIQRDGMEYEFDVVGDLDIARNISFSKSRCLQLKNYVICEAGGDVSEILSRWLDSGIEADPAETTEQGGGEGISKGASALLEKLNNAATTEAANALVPEIANLSDEDKGIIRPVFKEKMRLLQAPAKAEPPREEAH